MDHLQLYSTLVIQPIEDHIKYLRSKIYSRNFFDWLSRGMYKEHLEKAEQLWFDSLQKFGELVDEEIKWQDDFKKRWEESKKN